MALDTQLFFALNSLAAGGPLADAAILFFASYVPYLLVAGFCAYLAASSIRTRKEKIVAFLVAGLAALIARIGVGTPIHFFFPRPRPFLTHDVHQLITIHAASFPSGHALFFFAFSTVVFCYHRMLGVLFLIASTIVCLARVAAGIHYPSDILAGALIGVLCGYLSFRYLTPLLEGRARARTS